MSTNIVTAVFGGSKVVRTRALYQWDYGQMLQFSGLDLPDAYTVHFSNVGVGGMAKTMVGNADGVDIPDEYLTSGQTVYAWVYLHAGDADGETVYSVIIPVVARPQPTEDEPTPVQQGVVDQAIAALNAGVDRAEAAAEAAEQAVEGVQDSIDAALEAAKDSGEFDGADGVSPTATVTQTSTGATITVTDAQSTTTAEISNGQDGEPGAPGAPGTDGFSPTITVTDITGGHRVTITDATGPHSFDVMDGGGAVQDVQVNGVSVLSDGVANVPIASNNTLGVVKVVADHGIQLDNSKTLRIAGASEASIKAHNGMGGLYQPIVPNSQHISVFYGLARAASADMNSLSSTTVGVYPEAQKSAISEMLSGSVSVSGTAPVITALPGVRYICGEVSTLDITTPASGIIDVVFTSGSTPAVLTVTPPSGTTMKWANGFDPTSLEANTTYEINIADGVYGVVGMWS